jgi:hypothetical protein
MSEEQCVWEGWVLTHSNEYGLRVERYDENTTFKSDAEALAFVTERANAGSAYHQEALYAINNVLRGA